MDAESSWDRARLRALEAARAAAESNRELQRVTQALTETVDPEA